MSPSRHIAVVLIILSSVLGCGVREPADSPDNETPPAKADGSGGLPCSQGYQCVDPAQGDIDAEKGCQGTCEPIKAGGVTVETDKTEYWVGEKAWATVTNQSAASVFLSGCTQVSRELLENGQWVDKGRLVTCVWEGEAVEVKAGAAFTEINDVRFSSPGTWRLSLHYGTGCTPGQTLSQAGCTAFDTVYSQPVIVTKLTGQACGGFAGLPCPQGQTCVDDPMDSCDPQNGGADCPGICTGTATGQGVIVTTDKTQYQVGEDAFATITNNTTVDIFLSGCTQVSRQLLTGGQWVDQGRLVACFWEGFAVPVKAGTAYTEPTEVRFTSPGTWRVVAEYGLGCQSGQPLSGAGCSSFDTAASQPITVVP